MKKRTGGDHLSHAQTAALRKAIAQGAKIHVLAAKFNLALRTVQIHRAKMNGTFGSGVKKEPKPQAKVKVLCRSGACMKEGFGFPPYCSAHKPVTAPRNDGLPSFIKPLPMSKLMGGRA